MSTKTTFKRLALVTVAALGLGVLTTAPSQAAHLFDSVSLTAVKSAITTGETATATVALSFVNQATDSVTVNAVVTSGGASGGSLQFTKVVDSATSTTTSATGSASISTTGNGTAPQNVTASYTLSLVQPTTAGTYVVTVYTSSSVGTAIKATPVTWTVTVTAANVNADSTSTSFIAAGSGVPALVDSASVSSIKTAGVQAATILVTQANAAGTANESMTAIISGPGLLGTGSGTTAAAAGRAVTVKKGDYITVWGDNTTGLATIKITGNTSGFEIAQETVSFYDNKPASVSAAVKKAYILAGTNSVTGVFLATVKDALGNTIGSDNIVAVTAAPTDSSTAQTVGGAASCAYASATATTAAGYYCQVAGLSATKFGKVNYTITATGTDTAKTAVKTTADVTFSFGVAKTITITGPITGTPLQAVEYTFTAKDANGLPVADQAYNTAAGTNKIFGDVTTVSGFGSITNSTYTDTITTVSGVATFKGVLPMAGEASAEYTLAGVAGSLVANGSIDKSIVGTTIKVKTSVSNDSLEAANAATTAALAANDAVDALAATVAKLVAGLKAQITALTKLIVKIQKKVRA